MTVAALVSRLIAAGTPPEIAAMVVTEAFIAGAASSPAKTADPAAERRRAYDRERKQLTRDQRLPVSEWLELVANVLERDGHRCQYCGTDGQLTADHVVPASRGGSHETDNLVAACLSCNSKKSNNLLAEWLPDPRKSAGQNFVSEAAKAIIVRETSADVRRTPQISKSALIPKDKSKRVNTKHRLPADWQPKPSHFEAAEKLSIPRSSVLSKAEDMRIWAGSSGALKMDWDLTFHGFLRRDASKLAVRGSVAMTPIGPESPSWNAWKAYYRDNGKNFHAGQMDKSASDGKLWTVPTEWPPGHKMEAA